MLTLSVLGKIYGRTVTDSVQERTKSFVSEEQDGIIVEYSH